MLCESWVQKKKNKEKKEPTFEYFWVFEAGLDFYAFVVWVLSLQAIYGIAAVISVLYEHILDVLE